jgi:hypothetical protein
LVRELQIQLKKMTRQQIAEGQRLSRDPLSNTGVINTEGCLNTYNKSNEIDTEVMAAGRCTSLFFLMTSVSNAEPNLGQYFSDQAEGSELFAHAY